MTRSIVISLSLLLFGLLGCLVQSEPIVLDVEVALADTHLSLRQGESTTLNMSIIRNAPIGVVTIGFYGLPAGVSAGSVTFLSDQTQGSATFRADSGAAVGGPSDIWLRVTGVEERIFVDMKLTLTVLEKRGAIFLPNLLYTAIKRPLHTFVSTFHGLARLQS